MHCCLYITMLLNFILEGPIRIASLKKRLTIRPWNHFIEMMMRYSSIGSKFLNETIQRIFLSSQVLKITRRKGMYAFVMVSCMFFIGALLIGDLELENLNVLKLLLGVTGKFLMTMYFPIDGTYIKWVRQQKNCMKFPGFYGRLWRCWAGYPIKIIGNSSLINI